MIPYVSEPQNPWSQIPQPFISCHHRFNLWYNDLTEEMSSSIFSLIQNQTPSTTSRAIFSTRNDITHTYIRNENLWVTHSIDLTCIPACSGVNSLFDGVLVTNDIIIQAYHAASTNTIYFVDNDNIIVTSSISQSLRVGSTDILVSRLNPPIPSNITPAKILSSSSYSGSYVYFPSTVIAGRTIPVVFTNQSKSLNIGVVNTFYPNARILKSTHPELLTWYSPVIGGDSGAPFFLLINNQLVVLGTWYASNLTNLSIAPAISHYATQINSTIALLGSTSSLLEMDLSSYTQYNQ